MKWFSYCFWEYLLKHPVSIKKFFCRIGGHKPGPIFYNPGGLEPDMHCKECGDDLGE